MTVCWHVDYLKVSHMEPKEFTNLVEWLERIYGELRITRVKVHKYLGMTLDFRTPGELQIIMLNYLKVVLENILEVITGRSMSPAANHLFQVRPEDDWTIIYEEQATAFHHTLAQLLCVTSRDRKDINMDIYLLCTQVRSLDKYDW